MAKESFILYTKYRKQIERLTDAQRGVLFTAILQYASGEGVPQMDERTELAFDFIKVDLDENQRKYDEKCRTNAENGAKGGRPKKANEPNETEKTERFSENRPQAKKADNDNENDNDLKDKKDIVEIIDHLNRTCGTNYKATSATTQKHIRARLRDGFTLNDFKTVIDKKAREWLKDEKMRAYLRPETLFGTRFESYLNQIESGGGGSGFKGFEQRQYDYGEIQRRLVAKGGT